MHKVYQIFQNKKRNTNTINILHKHECSILEFVWVLGYGFGIFIMGLYQKIKKKKKTELDRFVN